MIIAGKSFGQSFKKKNIFCRHPKLMDKTLQAAVVSMANRQCGSDSKMEEERGEEQEEEEGGKEGDSHMRWLHEFVTLALPGSRHQVTIRTGHVSADTKSHLATKKHLK